MKLGEKNTNALVIRKLQLLFVLGTLFFFVGCGENAFQAARQEGTIQAFDNYLYEYPDDKNTAQAKELREKLYFESMRKRAMAADGDVYYVSGYMDSYLLEYPQGAYADQAKKLREQIWFNQVKESSQFQQLQTYLDEYPNGIYRDEIARLQEQNLYKRALETGESTDYEAYETRYPQGQYLTLLREKREENAFRSARAKNSVASYRDYLSSYPQGRFRKEAIEFLEAVDWEMAVRINTLQIYDLFLATYPESRFRSLAEGRRKERLFDKIGNQLPLNKGTNREPSERDIWEFTQKFDNLYQYEWFILNYPQSPYTEEALQKLEEKKQANNKLLR